MTLILTIIHIIVCFFLIVIVLLQHGKGADIGATFGGSGQGVFGTEGPLPLLNKITTSAAVIFMMTSISLAYLSSHRDSGSVMTEIQQAAPPIEAPLATPAEKQGPVTIPMPTADAENTGAAPAQFPVESSSH
ncbi:MAG: preprotein translocase subunit SecG [Proteobacteria bacterium]|nr:preprotein translocase subunit SecG [Pseudomonadota bacterium]MBU1711398.1 preprotein translocase subunit SecG [Pseudomonadota bacterium]